MIENTVKLKHGQLSKVADLVEANLQELKVQRRHNIDHNRGKFIVRYFDVSIQEWQKIREVIRKELDR